jgi:hypothetical protein
MNLAAPSQPPCFLRPPGRSRLLANSTRSIGASFALLLASANCAAGLTGNQLLEMHRAQPLLAQAYLTGVYDGMTALEGWRLSRGEPLTSQPSWGCPPSGVTNGQYVDVAIKALQEEPSRRHAEAAALATLAWRAAWPCPKP